MPLARSYAYENSIPPLVRLSSALSMLTVRAADQLAGRAFLLAATFAQGPTSGQQLGTNPINGQPVPFLNKQPVQGFSAVQENGGEPSM